MAFNFQTIDYSGLNDRRDSLFENVKRRIDGFADTAVKYQGWLERQGEIQKQQEEAERQAQILKNRKRFINQTYGDRDWSEYGPAAEIAYNRLQTAGDLNDFNEGYSQLANAINIYDQIQSLKSEKEDEEAAAAEAASAENEFAQDMYNFNSKDWGLANIGLGLSETQDTELSPAEIRDLQTKLGVKASGLYDRETIEAYDKALREANELRRAENDLKTKYGAKKFYDAMNEQNQQRMLERALSENKKKAYVAPKKWWEK